MNNIMTKAGKHDNNIKRAYDHIVFNKSKDIELNLSINIYYRRDKLVPDS